MSAPIINKFLYTYSGGTLKPLSTDEGTVISLQDIEIIDAVNSSDPTGLVTKSYVDTIAQGAIKIHDNVKVATTANLTATASGVGSGKTLTGDTSALTIDGILLSVPDRVLVKDQTDQIDNGIYYLSQQGNGSVPWILTRGSDGASVILGSFTFVTDGSENKNYGFAQFSDNVDIDVEVLKFSVFSALFSFIGGDGVVINANNVDLDLDSSSPLEIAGGKLNITKATASVDGYLDKTDFSTFLGKENALTHILPLDRVGDTITLNIVNDLTTGGASKVLSAEQGKVLKTTKSDINSPTFTGTVTIDSEMNISEPTKLTHPVSLGYFNTNSPGTITDLSDVTDDFGTQDQILRINENELVFTDLPGFFDLDLSPASVSGADDGKVLTVGGDGSVSFQTFNGGYKPEKGRGYEIDSSQETQGFVIISEEPEDETGIKVFRDEVGMQVGSSLIGVTNKTPDFKYINDSGTHKLYFKNLDGVTGLSDSGLFIAGSFYSVFYTAK